VRVRLGFNPYACDYGRATRAIREILLEWAEIDWFEPAWPYAKEREACSLFLQHNAIGCAHAPDLFGANVDVRCDEGGWERFAELCALVRGAGWDWKFSILKPLSSLHAKARGWSLDEQGLAMALVASQPGDLFTCYQDGLGRTQVLWNDLGGELAALATLPEEPAREGAGFYFGWARTDLFDAIKWQLARDDGDLSDNPFHLLVRCYRAGFYPFSFGRDTVVLFRFAGTPAEPPAVEAVAELPKATLLRRRKRRPRG